MFLSVHRGRGWAGFEAPLPAKIGLEWSTSPVGIGMGPVVGMPRNVNAGSFSVSYSNYPITISGGPSIQAHWPPSSHVAACAYKAGQSDKYRTNHEQL